MLPIAPIIFLVRALAESRSGGGNGFDGGGGNGGGPDNSRYVLWSLMVLGWACCIAFGLLALFDRIGPNDKPLATALWLLGTALVLAGPLFVPFPILRAIARRGHHRIVYYLAHLWLVFSKRNETAPAACLLSGLALAHRGNATRSELDWLLARISKSQGQLGTSGAAFAVYGAVRADFARRSGNAREAEEVAQTSRTILGTMTYLSPIGAPKPVMAIAYELLALDDARRGNWGGVLLAPWAECTEPVRILRAFVNDRLEANNKEPDPNEDPKTAAANERHLQKAKVLVEKRKKTLPSVDHLFSRTIDPNEPPMTAAMALAQAKRTYLALVRGEPVAPRAALNMLTAFDMFVHPEFHENVLTDELKNDAEALDAFHDELANAIAEPISRNLVPLFVLAHRGFGPISARVCQRVEVELFNELERALVAIDERRAHAVRRDPFGEGVEVSYVRSIYRRIQSTLGDGAARHVWPMFCQGYCRLGVQLSETWPRMRPLAHAVFKVLHTEAVRFEDHAHIQQQAHNLGVTSGFY